jgi:hypothetical protein
LRSARLVEKILSTQLFPSRYAVAREPINGWCNHSIQKCLATKVARRIRCLVLISLDTDLWVATRPLNFYSLSVGSRMTVVRLPGGRLFVHSPIALDEPLRAEVDALGTVRYLVAPNRWHHLFIKQWVDAYPSAQSFAAPRLPRKRPDVQFRAVLDDEPRDWAPELEHLLWRGAPAMSEVVFCHRPSRTLILTDSAHNLNESVGGWTRFVFKLLGGYGGFRSTLLDKIVNRDRAAARATVDKIDRWDFDRIIVAHGDVLATGGRDAFRAAYRWLT